MDSAVMFPMIFAIACFVAGMVYDEKKKKKVERQRELDRPKNEALFFDRCVEKGIFTISDNLGIKEEVRKTAIECNLLPTDTYLLSGKDQVMLGDVFQIKKESDEGRKKNRNKQKEIEKAEWAELTAYADLPPEDKLQTMAADEIRRLRGGPSPKLLQTKKTSDGMILAGTAAGIGGPIPALASLSRTAERNAQIEAYNQGVNAVNAMVISVGMNARTAAGKTEEMAKRFSSKKIADLPKEKILEYLHFDEINVAPYSYNSEEYKTGTLAVTVEMDPASIKIGDTSYFVDGSLTAEIFDGAKKVGEATLVLPMCGSSLDNHYLSLPYVKLSDRERVIKLKGICLYCKAAENKSWSELDKWKVKIVPGKYLWAMEDLSGFDKSQIDRA
ncbi:hypothetical protein DW094_02235 [Ruminococcaceae bacterium AM07-15]|nr:hypothetical protein DW094_02235 [Ruminococcaceae bacterium AM07-15]